jgi:hypothetical protein
VRVEELITLVGCALGDFVCACLPRADIDASGHLDAMELVTAVNNALNGCRASSTRTPTRPIVTCDPTLNGRTEGPPSGEQVIFRLRDGSSITLPDGSVEPLRGSLLVSLCLSPNTFFAARVEALRFASDSVVVESGCAAIGSARGSTLYGGDTPVDLASAVRIGGERFGLSGRGPHATQPGARVLDLNLMAGAYRLHLVAVGDVILNAGAEWPLCDAWGFV